MTWYQRGWFATVDNGDAIRPRSPVARVIGRWIPAGVASDRTGALTTHAVRPTLEVRRALLTDRAQGESGEDRSRTRLPMEEHRPEPNKSGRHPAAATEARAPERSCPGTPQRTV